MFKGEGEYNLIGIKEIKPTESYLGLDQDIRQCQNAEPFYNCTTERYHEAFLRECGCLPFSIRLSNEVDMNSSSAIRLFLMFKCSRTLYVLRKIQTVLNLSKLKPLLA